MAFYTVTRKLYGDPVSETYETVEADTWQIDKGGNLVFDLLLPEPRNATMQQTKCAFASGVWVSVRVERE